MPLPSETPIKPYDPFYQSELYGALSVDGYMTEELAKDEKEKFPEIKYVGQGQSGVVYDIGSDRVAKYTRRELEYKIAKELIKYPIDCTTKVFDAENLGFVYRIVFEKVKPLQSLEDMHNFTVGNNELRKLLGDCLNRNGWGSGDLHGANVGYNSDGNLVLLDIEEMYRI